MVTENGGTVRELPELRVVGALGQAGEGARCELWYENGKVIGAQSGIPWTPRH